MQCWSVLHPENIDLYVSYLCKMQFYLIIVLSGDHFFHFRHLPQNVISVRLHDLAKRLDIYWWKFHPNEKTRKEIQRFGTRICKETLSSLRVSVCMHVCEQRCSRLSDFWFIWPTKLYLTNYIYIDLFVFLCVRMPLSSRQLLLSLAK